jgi:hypothetical protein
MNDLRRYLSYKRIQDIPFPWEYEKLLKLPIFMKEEIYKYLDEFLEEEKKFRSQMQNGMP